MSIAVYHGFCIVEQKQWRGKWNISCFHISTKSGKTIILKIIFTYPLPNSLASSMKNVDTWVCSLPLSQRAWVLAPPNLNIMSERRGLGESPERDFISQVLTAQWAPFVAQFPPPSLTLPYPNQSSEISWVSMFSLINQDPNGCLGLGDPESVLVESPWTYISFFFFTEQST